MIFFTQALTSFITMAKTFPLLDIEETLIKCSHCHDLLRDPRLLPCLHRYCTDCLKTLFENQIRSISCNLCQEQFSVPINGVYGVKSDFLAGWAVQFLQLRKSFLNRDVKDCINCSQHLVTAGYCFKCNDYLCNQCCQNHLTNRTFKEHWKHILSANILEEASLSLKDLASLTVAPTCQTHTDRPSVVCCQSCVNLPICMVCGTLGVHQNHEVQDVVQLANDEREQLKRELTVVTNYKADAYLVRDNIEAVKKNLKMAISSAADKLKDLSSEKDKKIAEKFTHNDEELKICENELKRMKEEQENELEQARQSEIEEARRIINEKYERRIKTLEIGYERKLGGKMRYHSRRKKDFLKQIDGIVNKFGEFKLKLQVESEQNLEKLGIISSDLDRQITRYENLVTSAKCLQETSSDWTTARCMPAISTACGSLMTCMDNEFPELDSLARLNFVRPHTLMSAEIDSCCLLRDNRNQVVKIAGLDDNGSQIDEVALLGANFVVTSRASDGKVIIFAVDMTGNNLRTNGSISGGMQKFLRNSSFRVSIRYSPSRKTIQFTDTKAFIISRPHEIGIFDVSSDSCIKKNMRDVVKYFPQSRVLTCVSIDRHTRQVYIGTNSRYVYVFYPQLSYSHQVILPNIKSKSRDMAVHDDSLFVCDSGSNKAYAITHKGLRHFSGPDATSEWTSQFPLSVCSDNHGHVYILWRHFGQGQLQLGCSILQYSKEGSVLTRLSGPYDSQYMVMQIFDEGNNLVVATRLSKELHIFPMVSIYVFIFKLVRARIVDVQNLGRKRQVEHSQIYKNHNFPLLIFVYGCCLRPRDTVYAVRAIHQLIIDLKKLLFCFGNKEGFFSSCRQPTPTRRTQKLRRVELDIYTDHQSELRPCRKQEWVRQIPKCRYPSQSVLYKFQQRDERLDREMATVFSIFFCVQFWVNF